MAWQTLNPDLLNRLFKSLNQSQVDWLILPQRLTKALKSVLPTYQFHLLNQEWRELNPHEAELLKQEGRAWVRSITHQAGEKVLVEGFSIIPEATFKVLSESLENLESRPIGDTLLFDNPKVTRSKFYFQKVGDHWQRASIFFYEQEGEKYPLMVMERFVGEVPAIYPEEDGAISTPSHGGGRGGRPIIKTTSTLPSSTGGGGHALRLCSYFKLMRLHKPLPILLCLWPTLWGLWLAAGGYPGLKLLLIFVLGVLLMRSAGCVFNDIADRHVDKYVKRTVSRPIASGEISVRSAVILASVLTLLAFGLVCLTNLLTIELSFVALALALIYPLMKRITHFPQIVLGFAFNFGLVMAFAAVQGHIPLMAWPWYLCAILWTVMYDTYYALADKDDDEKIGIRSTAVFWGASSIFWIRFLQVLLLAFWGVLFLKGLNPKLIIIFLLLLLSFYRQNQFARDKHYLTAFLDNHWVGFLVWMGIVIAL